MSDTPRTDAAELTGWLSTDHAVSVAFSRQLERELAESQKHRPALSSFETMRWACGHKGGSSCEQCFQRVREERDAWKAGAEVLAVASASHMRRYIHLVDSGAAGTWNPEEEESVIRVRSALAEFEKLKGTQ